MRTSEQMCPAVAIAWSAIAQRHPKSGNVGSMAALPSPGPSLRSQPDVGANPQCCGTTLFLSGKLT